MLAALRSAGFPLGVVTSKGRRAWEVTTSHLDLGEFAVVLTEDDVAAPKPHPEGLLAAAAALDLPPERVVYIGDSLGDLKAARAAGMTFGATLWPKTAPGEREQFLARLGPLAPEWTFDRPADVSRAFASCAEPMRTPKPGPSSAGGVARYVRHPAPLDADRREDPPGSSPPGSITRGT